MHIYRDMHAYTYIYKPLLCLFFAFASPLLCLRAAVASPSLCVRPRLDPSPALNLPSTLRVAYRYMYMYTHTDISVYAHSCSCVDIYTCILPVVERPLDHRGATDNNRDCSSP